MSNKPRNFLGVVSMGRRSGQWFRGDRKSMEGKVKGLRTVYAWGAMALQLAKNGNPAWISLPRYLLLLLIHWEFMLFCWSTLGAFFFCTWNREVMASQTLQMIAREYFRWQSSWIKRRIKFHSCDLAVCASLKSQLPNWNGFLIGREKLKADN